MTQETEKPMAAKGFKSYRYRYRGGLVFIGAKDDADALREAQRSFSDVLADASFLEVWDGAKYVPVERGISL